MGIQLEEFENVEAENKFLQTTVKASEKIIKNLENEKNRLAHENETLRLENKLINAILYQECVEITVTNEDDTTYVKATFKNTTNQPNIDIGDILGLKK